MNRPRPATILIILLALASLCTTLLVALNIARQRSQSLPPPQENIVQTNVNLLWDNPLPLPVFALTERDGEPFSSEELRGKVWITDFFFTNCPAFCPRLTTTMMKLQDELKADLRWADIYFVSISVDPERDTPERLRSYAQDYHADPEHWLFLTGEKELVRKVIFDGFKQPMEDHTSKFVLVDRAGRIRGYYEAFDLDAMKNLRRDLQRVLDEGVAPASH